MTARETRKEPDLANLAGRVRHQMQRIEASGCYSDFGYPNLWGEFCHWVQYVNRGPIPDATWEETARGLIWDVVQAVPDRWLPQLTEKAEWELGAFDNGPEDGEPYIDRSLIERAVFSSLCEIAADRDIRRFVPPGLRDAYL